MQQDQQRFVASLELDTCFDDGETIGSVITKVTEGTAITGTVVTEHGPGGGWPVVLYTGRPDELAAMYKKHFSAGPARPDGTTAPENDNIELAALGLFVLDDVVIPVDPGWDQTGDDIAESELYEAAVQWAKELAEEPRHLVAKMLVVAGKYQTFDDALHALMG